MCSYYIIPKWSRQFYFLPAKLFKNYGLKSFAVSFVVQVASMGEWPVEWSWPRWRYLHPLASSYLRLWLRKRFSSRLVGFGVQHFPSSSRISFSTCASEACFLLCFWYFRCAFAGLAFWSTNLVSCGLRSRFMESDFPTSHYSGVITWLSILRRCGSALWISEGAVRNVALCCCFFYCISNLLAHLIPKSMMVKRFACHSPP